MVVAGSGIASAVGRDILQQGGNAVDAAVAVGFALAVVHPEAGNLGGGGFMVIRLKDGTVQTLDYRETAPSRATRDMYLDEHGEPTDRSLTGHLAAGVPGAVAGLTEALHRYGTLPLATVIAPAIRLARDGFLVDEYRSRSIGGDSARLVLFPASRASFLPNGAPPVPGTVLRQPDLATTLEAIRDRGADGFYRGPVADLIVAEMDRGGGLISHDDLAGYHAIWRDPIQVRYRGYTIYSMPPASSGGVTMGEILNIMEGYDPLPPFGTPALVHLEAEAMRRAFTDRNRYLGDPAFVQNPTDRLLSKAYAAELRRGIGERATPTATFTPAVRAGASTTHYSVVDQDGVAVSCTTTLNDSYGSAVTVTGAGFLLNDEMDDFATAPGQAQHVWPGPGRGERHRAGQAHALRHDAEPGARPGGPAPHGRGNAGRSAHHHDGVPRDLQRHRSPHAAGAGSRDAAHAPPGIAGHAQGRAGRLSAGDLGQPSSPRARDRDRGLLG